MRFNPHAFKRANGPDAASTSVVTDASAATNADTQPESVVPSSVVSLSPALAAFIAAYGRPGANQITVPEGSMAVTLSLKFNDSAAASGPLRLPRADRLSRFPRPARQEAGPDREPRPQGAHRLPRTPRPRLVVEIREVRRWPRQLFDKFPLVLPLAVTQSLTVRKTFGNGGPDAVSWEIQFANAWRGSPLQLWPHKHYGAPVVRIPFQQRPHDTWL